MTAGQLVNPFVCQERLLRVEHGCAPFGGYYNKQFNAAWSDAYMLSGMRLL